ncbi:MAG: type II toxin-antitoxin system RelE/ParE family toxin [Betaproteobacteria bacterium]|nr:type II toxin-antitoxin system RelE/ParE family toxin [Betaproteobacteria bacterium]
MALRLIWSPEAIEDIESRAAYIERDSAWYAKAVVSKIVATVDAIPEYPEPGRMVPERGDPAIRERLVYYCRIIYRVEATRLLIVAVIHDSRLLENLLSQRGS